MNMIEQFVDRLLQEKNLPKDLPNDVVEQMKSDLMSRVEDHINGMLIERMTPSQREAFEQLLDADASEIDTQSFISQAIPDLQNEIARVLMKFRAIFLGMTRRYSIGFNRPTSNQLDLFVAQLRRIPTFSTVNYGDRSPSGWQPVNIEFVDEITPSQIDAIAENAGLSIIFKTAPA